MQIIKIAEYDNEIIKNTSEDILESFNYDSIEKYEMVAENAIRDIKDGETIQIERSGFYIRDGEYFNLIPHTKQKKKIIK